MSDILIKGMKMPRSCYSCAHQHWSNYYQNYVCCAVWAEGDSILIHGEEVKSTDILRSGRSEKCPLVELPPHGRLIDADALDKAIGEEVHECDWDNSSFSGYRVWDLLDDAPTVIPADPAEEGER